MRDEERREWEGRGGEKRREGRRGEERGSEERRGEPRGEESGEERRGGLESGGVGKRVKEREKKMMNKKGCCQLLAVIYVAPVSSLSL